VTQRKVTGDKARRSSDLLLAVKRVEKIGTDLLDGLAPSRPFLSPSCRHLADYARQHIGRVLPADEVETLERLVDEIERVSTIGVGPVRLSRKEKLRECSRRGAARMAVSTVRSAASRCRTATQRRSQRLRAARSGRLASGARSRLGAAPSQSAATRRTP
jgi:hypothetical protein